MHNGHKNTDAIEQEVDIMVTIATSKLQPEPEAVKQTGDGETSSYIRVKFAREGIHRWKDCPHDEVNFLRDWHRHMFHFDVKIQVFHGDRELEFIMVKRMLEAWVEAVVLPQKDGWHGRHGSSCEHMAQQVLDFIIDQYGPQRAVTVEVLEDNENGGIVEYAPWIDWVAEAEKDWENWGD